MADIPQPASEPYEVGDSVRVYLAPDDPDKQYNDMIGNIVEVYEDNLDQETERELDRYSYRVDSDKGSVSPVIFRHSDLVPVDD